jgi:osmotically-inducible protein OsmY
MRTDGEFKTDVEDELRRDEDIDASGVLVAAHMGVVVLTGSVRSYMQKIHAECVARRVVGPMRVTNNVHVRLPYINKRPDPEIAEVAVEKLQKELPYSSQFLKVTVRDAWLALEGTLERSYQRDRAKRAISAVIGVVGVSDNIMLKPLAAESDVKRKFTEAIKRSAELDAQCVALESAKTKITVGSGLISWAQRTES